MAVIATGLGFAADIGDFIGKHNPFFMRASADGLEKKIEAVQAKHEEDKKKAAAAKKKDDIERTTNTETRVFDQLYRARNEKEYLDSTNAKPERTRSLTEHIQNLQKQYKRANERLEALEK